MLAASIVGNPILTCWSLMEFSGHVSRWNCGEMSQTQHMDLLSSPPICLLHLFICRDSRIAWQKHLEKVRAPIQQKLFSLTVPTPWLCPAMKKGRSAPRVCRKWRNALRRSWYATSKACHGSKNPKRKVGVSFSGPSLFKGYLAGAGGIPYKFWMLASSTPLNEGCESANHLDYILPLDSSWKKNEPNHMGEILQIHRNIRLFLYLPF